jgi:hypothetical protein
MMALEEEEDGLPGSFRRTGFNGTLLTNETSAIYAEDLLGTQHAEAVSAQETLGGVSAEGVASHVFEAFHQTTHLKTNSFV